MADVQIMSIAKKYGTNQVVRDICLHVQDGEFVSLLGPSGCGKTTLLRMIAGFIEPTGGEILVGGTRIDHIPPYRRDIGMVFQNYALFPHMTVAQNVEFGLKMRKASPKTISHNVAEALKLVKLTGLESRYPRELSGGQQQRVAIARALAIRPKVLLMDEPLSNLDAKLRVETRVELRRIQKETNITTVFVTHDQEEALIVSDRIAVMHNGIIEQIGKPCEVYDKPKTHFVANFIGRTNFFTGKILAGEFISNLGFSIPVDGTAAGSEAALSIRPELMRLTSEPQEGLVNLSVKVKNIIFMGSSQEFVVECNNESFSVIIPKQSNVTEDIPEGATAYVSFDPRVCRVV